MLPKTVITGLTWPRSLSEPRARRLTRPPAEGMAQAIGPRRGLGTGRPRATGCRCSTLISSRVGGGFSAVSRGRVPPLYPHVNLARVESPREPPGPRCG